MNARRALSVALVSCLTVACSGSSGSEAASGGAVASRSDFVAACDRRPASGGDAGSCSHAGKCDALYSCISVVVEPALHARVLECETQACTADGKRGCLEKAAQTVTDASATAWAATCDDRAGSAGVSDDACQKGAAGLSAAYRAEFDRCLGLSKDEAGTCVAKLNAPCESTYF